MWPLAAHLLGDAAQDCGGYGPRQVTPLDAEEPDDGQRAAGPDQLAQPAAPLRLIPYASLRVMIMWLFRASMRNS